MVPVHVEGLADWVPASGVGVAAELRRVIQARNGGGVAEMGELGDREVPAHECSKLLVREPEVGPGEGRDQDQP